MCIFFFSIKTTNLTLCSAVVRESTLSVREYGFAFSKWTLVPNQGWCFWLFKQTKTRTILWADLQKSGYNWHQCRLMLKDSTTFTNRCTGCEKIVLRTHIPMGPVLPDLLEFFVSPQIIILQSSAWFF
jgi:hypothetical protein